MDLSDYHEHGDLERYFINTVLPFSDANGRQRLGLVQGYRDGKFIYKPNLPKSNGWSSRNFRKSWDKFDFNPNLTGKMVDHQGEAHWIDPVGSRTTAKGISSAHFRVRNMHGGSNQRHDSIEHQPELIFKFLYQEEYLSEAEARDLIRGGEVNSVALSPDVAIFSGEGENYCYSYMGMQVQSIEGLIDA